MADRSMWTNNRRRVFEIKKLQVKEIMVTVTGIRSMRRYSLAEGNYP
jgi:hypothetical protein